MLDSLYFLRLTGLCFVSYTKQGIRYDPNGSSVKSSLESFEIQLWLFKFDADGQNRLRSA